MRSTSWDMNQRNCRFVVTDRCSDSSQHWPAEEVTWDSSSWVFKPWKFNIGTEKWWLEDYFPFKARPVFRGYVRFPESLQLFAGICYCYIPQLPIVALLQCLRGYENWLIVKYCLKIRMKWMNLPTLLLQKKHHQTKPTKGTLCLR